jgi:methionine synthase II (cobalamin-independent)
MARKKFIEEEVRNEAFEKYSKMTNDELMDNFMKYSVGDDYYGDYTKDGEVRWDVIYNEMMSRLKGVGFLSEKYII